MNNSFSVARLMKLNAFLVGVAGFTIGGLVAALMLLA
jgi:hypothetical protein